jgi:hypothetical protein
MGKAESALPARARELWGNRAGRPITDDEAQEIIENMAAFAELIIDWYLADWESCAHSSAEPNTSSDADPSCRE